MFVFNFYALSERFRIPRIVLIILVIDINGFVNVGITAVARDMCMGGTRGAQHIYGGGNNRLMTHQPLSVVNDR